MLAVPLHLLAFRWMSVADSQCSAVQCGAAQSWLRKKGRVGECEGGVLGTYLDAVLSQVCYAITILTIQDVSECRAWRAFYRNSKSQGVKKPSYDSRPVCSANSALALFGLFGCLEQRKHKHATRVKGSSGPFGSGQVRSGQVMDRSGLRWATVERADAGGGLLNLNSNSNRFSRSAQHLLGGGGAGRGRRPGVALHSKKRTFFLFSSPRRSLAICP